MLVDVLVDQRHRWLGQDRQLRYHDLELVLAQFLARQQRLVFPGQQHITDPTLHERGGCAARAGIQHRHIAEQGLHVAQGALAVALEDMVGVRPGGQIVPARATGGLRIRGHHRHARAQQVRPVMDVLGVALAHQKHNGRGVRRTVVGQARFPIGIDQLGLLRDGIHVVGQRQRHHVGLDAIDHSARLLARAAVRGFHGDGVLRVLLFPVRGKSGVVVAVELAGGVVAHVKQPDLACACRAGQDQQGAKKASKTDTGVCHDNLLAG